MRQIFFALFSFLFLMADARAGSNSPNVSLNALLLYRNSNFHQADAKPSQVDTSPNGLGLQEAEVQFYSDVDPYTRMNVVFTLAPEITSDGTTISQGWIFEPEEAYIESLSLPQVTLKAGKFKAAVGKHNTLHTHAFPLIEAPLANVALLGDEGLNDIGLSAAWLMPTPWFSEWTLQYLRGKGENAMFLHPSPNEGVGVAHWKNLVDLSEATTLEAGVSWAQGGNSFRENTQFQSADLTLKWRPEQGGLYQSLSWAIEYLGRQQKSTPEATEKGQGLSSWIAYQWDRPWSVVYRWDQLALQDSLNPADLPNETWSRHSLGVAYAPSEFSSYRIEYNQRHGGPGTSADLMDEKVIFLQGNFTIGSHPAHTY